MSFKATDFQLNYQLRGGTLNAARSYRSYLNQLDRHLEGLDEKIEQIGPEAVLEWALKNVDPRSYSSPSSTRSALKRYLQFIVHINTDNELVETDSDLDEAIIETTQVKHTLFQYEKELQAAVRQSIAEIEPGLTIADGGSEKIVATGRTDIFATNAAGHPVVIELKVGECPRGALEQVLGYA